MPVGTVLPLVTVAPVAAALMPAKGPMAWAASKSTRLEPTSPTRTPVAKSMVPLLMSSEALLMPGPLLAEA